MQHKQDIDYRNLTSLEIDLSNQTLETLEEFLLSSNKDRRWINNEVYFHGIEDRYRSRGKKVKVVSEIDCWQCDLNGSCCAVKQAVASKVPISIENNGQRYRLCKTELREQEIQRREEENLRRQQISPQNNRLLLDLSFLTKLQTKQQKNLVSIVSIILVGLIKTDLLIVDCNDLIFQNALILIMHKLVVCSKRNRA